MTAVVVPFRQSDDVAAMIDALRDEHPRAVAIVSIDENGDATYRTAGLSIDKAMFWLDRFKHRLHKDLDE